MIIVFCSLLLLAYLFDLTSSRTKIPSVIFLLLLGWGLKRILEIFEIDIPGLMSLLPVFGTIGLIMIVLEGALELQLNVGKRTLITKSFLSALVSMLVLSFCLAFLFMQYNPLSFRLNLLNTIPFCVISSSIAIPSAKYLTRSNREFVTYESSLSDIFGVLFFNFLLLNETVTLFSLHNFGVKLLLIIVVSLFATILLAILLSKIDHHIKFVPIILLVILIYEISKIYHLPALLFIMLFGLFIGNLDELKQYKIVQRLKPDLLDKEVNKFKDILTEATFLIRSVFFLLFGYFINGAQLLDPETFVWTAGIVALMFLIRIIQLKIAKLPLIPLLFVAPRGLITILLFFSIGAANRIPLVNDSLITQVIVLTALIMMVGLMINKRQVNDA